MDESKEEDRPVLNQLKIISSCHFWRWNSQCHQVSVDGVLVEVFVCKIQSGSVPILERRTGQEQDTAESLGTADRVILWLKVIKTKQ